MKQCKTCTCCVEEKPISEFSPQKGGKFGVTSKCRPCCRKINSDWAKSNREKCRARVRRWRSENREKVLIIGRSYYQKTRSNRIKSVIAWQKRNPEKKKFSSSVYRANHQGKLKEWRKSNRDTIYDLNKKREDFLRRATPSWLSKSDKMLIIVFYAMSIRLSKCTGIPHHVDHIHPLKGKTSCGLHVPWNLRAIPARLNLKKKNN